MLNLQRVSDFITSNLRTMFNKSFTNKVAYKLVEKDLILLKDQVNRKV